MQSLTAERRENFRVFCAITANIPTEKTGGRRDNLWTWLPFFFLYPACPVMGKSLRCPRPRPGTSGSKGPVPTDSTPHTPQHPRQNWPQEMASPDVVYSLTGNLPPLQKSLNFMSFHYHEMEVLYPVKEIAVIPVQVEKLGGKSYLVPFPDP